MSEHTPVVVLNRMDSDSFNQLTVIAQRDTMSAEGVVTATVLFGSYPVAMITTDRAQDDMLDGYRMSPLVDEVMEWNHDSPQAQAYVAFLAEIGTVTGDGVMDWQDQKLAMHTLFDEYGDEGHAWLEFLEEVAAAIHAAFPEITADPGI